MTTRLLVGLGNPGEDYEGTRHNAGFAVIDALGETLGASYWKSECGALSAHVERDGEQLVLAKPQAFMNCSGGPVSKLATLVGAKPEEILVVHDDLDLEPGSIRVKVGGGHAGHNGLRSISDKIGTGYIRVRVGIGHPPGRMAGADYVLSRLRGEDAEAFEHALALAHDAALRIVDEGPTVAMNAFN